jgi:hypothetical protein
LPNHFANHAFAQAVVDIDGLSRITLGQGASSRCHDPNVSVLISFQFLGKPRGLGVGADENEQGVSCALLFRAPQRRRYVREKRNLSQLVGFDQRFGQFGLA